MAKKNAKFSPTLKDGDIAIEEENLQGNFIHKKSICCQCCMRKCVCSRLQKKWKKEAIKADAYSNVETGTRVDSIFRKFTVSSSHDIHVEHFAFILDLDSYHYGQLVVNEFLNEILQSSMFR